MIFERLLFNKRKQKPVELQRDWPECDCTQFDLLNNTRCADCEKRYSPMTYEEFQLILRDLREGRAIIKPK
jgi:hypothetical protein